MLGRWTVSFKCERIDAFTRDAVMIIIYWDESYRSLFQTHWKWFIRKRQHNSAIGLQTMFWNRSIYWAVAEVIHDTWVTGSLLYQKTKPCVETELKKQHCQHWVLRRGPSVHVAPCSASRYVKILVQYSKTLIWMEFVFKYVINIDTYKTCS